jgi:WD40 repeat protein
MQPLVHEAVTPHYQPVCALYHPGDDFFFIGLRSGNIVVWNGGTRAHQQTLAGHTGPVNALLLLENGCVASAGNDTTVRIWESSGTERAVLRGHQAWVSQLALLPGNRFASADSRGDIRVWDTRTYTCLRTLTASFGWAQLLVSLSDGQLASSCMNNTVQLWDADTGRQGLSFSDRYSLYTLAQIGRHLVTGGAGDTLSVWDPLTGNCLRVLQGAHRVSRICELPRNRIAARGDTLTVWDLTTGQQLPVPSNPEDGVCALIALPDGILIGGGRDGTLYVWDCMGFSIRCMARLDGGHSTVICDVALLRDGTLLSLSIDGTACVWDCEWLPRRRAMARCADIKENLMAAAWNPERVGGEWLVLEECKE